MSGSRGGGQESLWTPDIDIGPPPPPRTSLIFTVTCDQVFYDWKCDRVNSSSLTPPPHTNTHFANTHTLPLQIELHTTQHITPPPFPPPPSPPFRKRRRRFTLAGTFVGNALLISAKVTSAWDVYEYWFVSSYMNQSTTWTGGLALFDQKTVSLWWLLSSGCVLTWPRFQEEPGSVSVL